MTKKLTYDERIKLAQAIALQEFYLNAAIRMTRHNLQTPLLKRNRQRGRW